MRGRALLALLVVVLVAIPVLAQVTPIPEERVGRIIEALLIWRLVDELDLTEQQIARLFPRIKQLKDLRLELGGASARWSLNCGRLWRSARPIRRRSRSRWRNCRRCGCRSSNAGSGSCGK